MPHDPTAATSSAANDQLNTPPPTLAAERPATPPTSIQDLAGPQVPAGQIPEPLRQGAESLAQQIGTGVDGLAQLFPEFAANFGIVRIALDQAMQAVNASAGTQAVTPTTAGAGFPGGGLGSPPTPTV